MITVTENALPKIKDLMADKINAGKSMRIFFGGIG